MTAPGWYQADGDPAGTNRYWDGERWVGEAVPVPGAAGADAGGYGYADGSSQTRYFPSGLKTLAIVVSVLKAVGWVAWLIGAIWLVSFLDDARDFDNAFGEIGIGAGDAVGAVVGTMAVILLIGGALLFFQFRYTFKENASSLFVVALIMSILDALAVLFVLLGAASDGGGGNIVALLVYAATFAGQLMVAIKAKQVGALTSHS